MTFKMPMYAYEYSPAPARLLIDKWCEQHGVTVAELKNATWVMDTRTLVLPDRDVKTLTPPPGFERSRA